MKGKCPQARIWVLAPSSAVRMAQPSHFTTPDPPRPSLRNGGNHLCPAKPPDSSRPDPGSDKEKEATALRKPAGTPQTSQCPLAPFPKISRRALGPFRAGSKPGMAADPQEARRLRFLLLLRILVTRKPPHEACKPRIIYSS